MSIGFGKYDSIEAIIGHEVMLNGFSDDSITFGEYSGEWADRINGPVTVETLVSLMGDEWRTKLLEECSHGHTFGSAAGHHGYEWVPSGDNDADETTEHGYLIDESVSDLATCAGIIITGDSNGFVYGESYSSAESLDKEWDRLRQVESDLYRDAMREEHSEWVKHGGEYHPSDDLGGECEDCAPVEGFSEGDAGHDPGTVSWQGVAARVVGFDSGSLILVMVGDDARHSVDPRDVSAIPAEGYCSSCGQVGCYGDGRPTEED